MCWCYNVNCLLLIDIIVAANRIHIHVDAVFAAILSDVIITIPYIWWILVFKLSLHENMTDFEFKPVMLPADCSEHPLI